jgi:hypothetical protein
MKCFVFEATFWLTLVMYVLYLWEEGEEKAFANPLQDF